MASPLTPAGLSIDALLPLEIDSARRRPHELEEAGCDGLWVGETAHDPFLQSLLAVEATARVPVGTAVAIAFARNPMTVAHAAYDLARYARGRFRLGLGTQVKAHIERRFSMPWSHPAERMAEFVQTLRAIWTAWDQGSPLDVRGQFYRHTLMTPFFAPQPHEWGPPPIYLAGVGERMVEVAGELADGFLFHPFTSPTYLSGVIIPALRRGAERGGRDPAAMVICGPAMIATGTDERTIEEAVTAVRQQIAFYASTPPYRAVLDVHGWGELQAELTSLSKAGRWTEMGGLVDDEVLAAFAVVGSPDEVAAGLRSRYAGLADRVSLYLPDGHDPGLVVRLLAARRGH